MGLTVRTVLEPHGPATAIELDAKKPETRERRIAACIAKLTA